MDDWHYFFPLLRFLGTCVLGGSAGILGAWYFGRLFGAVE